MRWMVSLFVISLFVGYALPSSACTPNCTGKQCGSDGCGGTCGTCKAPAQCVVDQCVKGCGSVPDVTGCCYKGFNVHCWMDEEGKFIWGITKCKNGKVCAWPDTHVYTCLSNPDTMEDPSGRFPRDCDFRCVPDCEGKNCGPDGCGGTCGKCPQGDVCIMDGTWQDGTCCHPDCDGKECGSDGCGGFCGFCVGAQEVCKSGKCVNQYGCIATIPPGCPDCACEQCVCEKDPGCCFYRWDDQCTQECKNDCGGCKKCVPDCDGKECGSDGCGGFCGYCNAGDTCKDGKCVKCVPDCAGKVCGDDGCGGSCGQCQGTDVCDQGQCRACKEECESWQNCGYPECGGPPCQSEWDNNPGTPGCQAGAICRNNYCVPCVPYCRDRECGDDGCDGSCGTCGPCAQCISHHCKPIPDCEAPEPVPEPVPDIAEDVRVGHDVTEVLDPGSDPGMPVNDPGMDTRKDSGHDQAVRPEISTDFQSGHHDAISADTASKSSGGGCSTGAGSASGIWLILLGVFALLLRRVRGRVSVDSKVNGGFKTK